MKDLPSALKMLADLSQPELRLVVDFMHILRSGCSVAELAAVDPALIGYVQISDVPLRATVPNYGEESLHHRLPIGEGDVPVRELLAVLPRDLLIGIEAPMTDKARAGMAPRERLASSVEFVRRLLVEAGK